MPQQESRRSQTGLHVLAGLLTALTFVADLSLPPGVVSGMPYAILVAVVSMAVCLVPVAYGLPWWIGLTAGATLLYLVLRVAGRTPPDPV